MPGGVIRCSQIRHSQSQQIFLLDLIADRQIQSVLDGIAVILNVQIPHRIEIIDEFVIADIQGDSVIRNGGVRFIDFSVIVFPDKGTTYRHGYDHDYDQYQCKYA